MLVITNLPTRIFSCDAALDTTASSGPEALTMKMAESGTHPVILKNVEKFPLSTAKNRHSRYLFQILLPNR